MNQRERLKPVYLNASPDDTLQAKEQTNEKRREHGKYDSLGDQSETLCCLWYHQVQAPQFTAGYR